MRVFLLAFCLAATAAAAQMRQPTDLELRTAYCITAIKQKIAGLGSATDLNAAQKNYVDGLIRDRNNDLNRLQAYLLPKLTSLDATALLAASNRAEVDTQDRLGSMNKCSVRCQSGLDNNASERWVACMKSCNSENPAVARVDSCERPDWLPF